MNSAWATDQFTERDIQFLSGFTLVALPPPPDAPDNSYADNIDAARLGQSIFFDKGFSSNGNISCASCHQPGKYFSDGLQKGRGIGETRRNTPSLLGAVYGPWQYWDGRKGSLWSQALEPLEQSKEHGFTRSGVYQRITAKYRQEYEAIFSVINAGNPDVETRVFVNVGKSLMAYQRRLQFLPSRFDHYVASLRSGEKNLETNAFSRAEINGLRLFMGKAACASCHNGPLFTNFEFHNTGAPEPDKNRVDLGRFKGIEKLRADEFNCLSIWSDAEEQQCNEMNYLKKLGPELVGAFKTPSLRNVGKTAPYMQAGQISDLKDVVAHYNLPTPPYYNRDQHPNRPHFDILPLGLNEKELDDLVAFLESLTSPIPKDDPWWKPPN